MAVGLRRWALLIVLGFWQSEQGTCDNGPFLQKFQRVGVGPSMRVRMARVTYWTPQELGWPLFMRV
jgi:hypothetical protein